MKLNLNLKFNSKSLFEVVIDERIWGVLPRKLLKAFSAKDDIDNDEFKELRELLYNYSRDRLFTYLTQQEHSEHECRLYLRKLKLHRSIIDSIIEFCLDKKFISDARLAELYVRSMIELGKSKTEISYKLKNKGVDSNLIEHELDLQYNDVAKKNVLNDNIDKAVRIYSNRGAKDVYNKVCSYLIRKGFYYGEFSDLLKNKLNRDDETS